jgi:outer membrane lipoprotein LolB
VPPDEVETVAPAAATDGSAFRLSGRIGVMHNGESFSGTLRWRHSVEEDEIFILSPLGQGVARIARGPDGVTLETAEGEGYRGPDVESLTEEVLGWRLPARGLPYWVAGRPAPDGASDGEMDERLQLRTLRQDGWRIDYLDYRMVQGELRPSKLELVMGDRLKLRLVIDSWVLP